MILHQAVLVEVHNPINRRLARRGIPPAILSRIDQRHGRGTRAGETRTCKQRPKPRCILGSVGRREEIARGDTHGRAERLEQARADGLLDVAAAVARDVADG